MTSVRLAIISGAGASAGLGADGDDLPMMSEWATSLVERLGYAAEIIGLRASMPGEEFEAALGRFIAFANALPTVEPLSALLGVHGILGDPSSVSHTFDAAPALQTAAKNVREIQLALQRNLYEQFSHSRIDPVKAYGTYSSLHAQIRDAFDAEPVFLAHVTTNFDLAIESAIGILEIRDKKTTLIDGFARSFGGAADIWSPNLLSFSHLHDAEVPVLHLHGAIGWYFSDDGESIRRRPSNDPFDDRLTPALLLPDDQKDIRTFPGPLKQVWEQFREIVRNSTHVLVVGHSLHDQHLVALLQEFETPVAVVVFTEPNAVGEFGPPPSSEVQKLQKLLPKATFLAGKLAHQSDGPDVEPHSLKLWLRENRPRG